MKVLAIYEPPDKALPYLVASFGDSGVEVRQAQNKEAAEALLSQLKTESASVRERVRVARNISESA